MNATEAAAELTHAKELLKRIEAMVNNAYWSSERRWRIGECAQKAALHLKKAEQCLQPNIPTSSSSDNSSSGAALDPQANPEFRFS